MSTLKAAKVAQPVNAPCQPAASRVQGRRVSPQTNKRVYSAQQNAPDRARKPPVKQPADALLVLSCCARTCVRQCASSGLT